MKLTRTFEVLVISYLYSHFGQSRLKFSTYIPPLLLPGVIAPLAWEEGEPLSRAESRMSRIVRVSDKSKQYLVRTRQPSHTPHARALCSETETNDNNNNIVFDQTRSNHSFKELLNNKLFFPS